MTTAVTPDRPPPGFRFAWLFRYSNLVLASAVLALGALVWVLWPKTASNLPRPLPVRAGDAEVVWLQTASNAAVWERFVTAVEQAARDCPELQVEIGDATFPPQAAACPQLSLSVRSKPGRVVVRWYKLTSDWKTSNWVKALLAHNPPPLAIIGGDSSEAAIDLARALRTSGANLPEAARPLLFVTNATADKASRDDGDGSTLLTHIYAQRTFRFCFTNRQMAEAVIAFIWSRDDLRPDTEPVYMVYWADDPYSNDLTGSEGGFRKALAEPAAQSGAVAVVRDLGWLAGSRTTAALPLNLEGMTASQFRLGALTPPQMIDSGVGTFDWANSFEAATAGYLLNELSQNPGQRRPLLLLSAQQQPIRRFLRAVVRAAPTDSQRFVVGTGDSIGFNSIYRDRNIIWPIQDLPFSLVFFAHRDPVDPSAGFRAENGQDDLDGNPRATSTDTLLLYRDIIETLVQAAWEGDRLVPNAEALREALGRAVWQSGGRIRLGEEGAQLFDRNGNRSSGTGAHVVWLHPATGGEGDGLSGRVLPQATITVWPVPPDLAPWRPWKDGPSRSLKATYEGTLKGALVADRDPSTPVWMGKAPVLWTYVRNLAAPAVLIIIAIIALKSLLPWWLGAREKYDEEAVREWIKEARVSGETLRDLAGDYTVRAHRLVELTHPSNPAGPPGFVSGDPLEAELAVTLRRQDIQESLKALGVPPTKMYGGQLPLFPVIYSLEVRFHAPELPEELRQSVHWDSGLPRRPGQYRVLDSEPIHEHASVTVQYQLHTFHKLQQDEQADAEQQQWVTVLAVVGTVPALVWIWFVRRRERERERQQSLAQHQIDQAQRLLLEEELRRQEAERRREDAERQALELKSRMFASIGIMAGSYAHNIKNLLVRPNDLLNRCLEVDGLPASQRQMLHEVHETLGTVTERLQQILRTVRRDPTRADLSRLDLNMVLDELVRTWKALALDKWKMVLDFEACEEPSWVEADLSHLQQAVENLLFNARDATFEMRNHLRNLARTETGTERKKALIAAAAWKGQVTMRCHNAGDQVVIEVTDNGIGMTEEVRRRCLEPHFTTKRDNALYEGHSTGMGLGLSFVAAILERHRATLEIDSEPLRGTTFRIRFPLEE